MLALRTNTDDMDCYILSWIVFCQFYCTNAGDLYLNGNDIKNITCNDGEKINILYAAFNNYNSRCSETGSRCKGEIQRLKGICNGKQTCEISLTNYSCPLKPRYIDLSYTCRLWNSFDVITRRTGVCGTFQSISCWRGHTISTIIFDFEYFGVHNTPEQPESTLTECLIADFNHYCTGQYHKCLTTSIPSNQWCFYLTFHLNVKYTCIIDESYPKSNLSTLTMFPSRVTPRTVHGNESSSDIYGVSLGLEKRIIVTNSQNKENFTVCAKNWTDTLASIVCKYLNISTIGEAGVIKRDQIFERISYGFTCKDGETNPYNCEPDMSNNSRLSCESIGDATVNCFDSNSSKTSGLIGVVIGGVVILLLVVIIIVLMCVRHKKHKQIKKQHLNTINKRTKSGGGVYNYSESLDMDMCEEIQEPNTNYFILVQGAGGNGESQYMSTPEGAYDISNDRRHKNADDANIYDHSIADVYDVTNHNRPHDDDDTNLYNQTNIDGIYNTSGNTNKQRTGTYDL